MTELAREYATGLYDLAQEEQLTEDMLGELQALSGCMHDAPEFGRLLCNMSLGKNERVAIIDHALRGQVHPYLLNFLKLLCERGAMNEFGGCVAAYCELYDEAHGIIEATVTTSKALNENQRRRMIDKLSQMTQHEIRLHEKVDETVLGGVLLEMDGKRYDNTVRQHLKAIRSAMDAER